MKVKYQTIDGKLFDSEQSALYHEKRQKVESTSYGRYINVTYSGQQLLKKHTLDEYGIWQVLGEDPNCDLGGHHYNPNLGYIEGNLKSVIEKAVGMKGFWTWGYGGEIKKIEVKHVDTL